jgi:chromosome segregation ATPase
VCDFRTISVQIPNLGSVAPDAEQRARFAEERQAALQQDVQRLQAQLESAHQRMAILKGQLISGQAEAEACEQQMIQDAVDQVETQWRLRLQSAQDEVRFTIHLCMTVQSSRFLVTSECADEMAWLRDQLDHCIVGFSSC